VKCAALIFHNALYIVAAVMYLPCTFGGKQSRVLFSTNVLFKLLFIYPVTLSVCILYFPIQPSDNVVLLYFHLFYLNANIKLKQG